MVEVGHDVESNNHDPVGFNTKNLKLTFDVDQIEPRDPNESKAIYVPFKYVIKEIAI